jgi:POLQ-like helicase
VSKNIDKILNSSTQEDLFETIWPAIFQQLKNQTIRKLDPTEAIKDLAYGWVQGVPFFTLYEDMVEKKVLIKYGLKSRALKIEHIVDICENALSYEGMLAVGAITEFCLLMQPDNVNLVSNLQELQKRIKYGVTSFSAITLYEMGFADRAIAMDLSVLAGNVKFRNKIISGLRRNEDETRKTIDRYPAYFRDLLNSLL